MGKRWRASWFVPLAIGSSCHAPVARNPAATADTPTARARASTGDANCTERPAVDTGTAAAPPRRDVEGAAMPPSSSGPTPFRESNRTVAFDDWISLHHATLSGELATLRHSPVAGLAHATCIARDVGVPPRAGLVCEMETQGPEPAYIVLEQHFIVGLQGREAVVLWQGPRAMYPLDNPACVAPGLPCDSFRLEIALADDGASFTIYEPAPYVGRCVGVQPGDDVTGVPAPRGDDKPTHAQIGSAASPDREDVKVMGAACATMGFYDWHDGAFRRSSTQKPPLGRSVAVRESDGTAGSP